MTFKVAVETLDSVRRRLAVEVPADEVETQIEKAYAELGRDAKVRGFRQGRVPRHVLERLFGDKVRGDVFGRLMQQSFREAIEQGQIEAVSQPEFVTEQAERGAALRYSATVEVKPDITVQGYEGMDVDRPLAPVKDSDVASFLERLRQSLAQLHPITERTHVESGDVVTLDYQALVDGRVVGRAENREVEIGASSFPPEFEKHVLGAAVGAELEFSISYPAEHGAAEVAGKTVQFRVAIRGMSQKELPPLDDEFAKDHGECATLDELRQRLRRQLEDEAGRRADEAMRGALISRLAEAHDILVPPALVQRRLDAMIEEVMSEWQRRRIQPRNRAESLARLSAELEPQARQQVKISLLLDAITRQENVKVEEHEVEQRVEALAAASGVGAERLRALYQNPEARQQLRTRMLHSRALDLVASKAHIHTVERKDNVAEAEENS